MSINFRGSARDEVQILRSELNSNKLEVRRKAVKKVIAAMTVGKDVSMLFTHVLKCVETEDVELKKLVYLYIINYSKAQPDLALMAINTFRKDSTERVNPLVRSLAVRTMGCIGIEEMLEYLLIRLRDLIASVRVENNKAERVSLDFGQWQYLVDIQARLGEMLRSLTEPDRE